MSRSNIPMIQENIIIFFVALQNNVQQTRKSVNLAQINSKNLLQIIKTFDMKTGFAIIAGLLVADGVATNFGLDLGGCNVQRTSTRDSFGCPCTATSGKLEWKFSDLPDGWSAENDRVVAPRGKFQDNKVYGAKVEVYDKDKNQSYKKSLYFSFKQGKVEKIADEAYDYDVSDLIPRGAKNNAKPGTAFVYGVSVNVPNYGTGKQLNNDDRSYQRVKGVFDGVSGIGGGSNLSKISHYLTGNGLYRGDDQNPYFSRLPEDKDFDTFIKSGSSRGVRDVITNACQGQSDPRDILNWLERVDQRFRNNSYAFNDDSNGLRNIFSTIKDQRSYHQGKVESYWNGNYFNGNDIDFRRDYNGKIGSYYGGQDGYYNIYNDKSGQYYQNYGGNSDNRQKGDDDEESKDDGAKGGNNGKGNNSKNEKNGSNKEKDDDKYQHYRKADQQNEYKDRDSFDKYASDNYGFSKKGNDAAKTNIRGSGSGSGIWRLDSVPQKVITTVTNIFSDLWGKTHGNPLDWNGSDKSARKFEDDDFTCDSGVGGGSVQSFRGQVKQISKNTARVVNDKGVECNLYFGGCSKIETSGKPLPQVGDEIYWRGVSKKGGKNTDYNVFNALCF